ncbi:hypothetical protein FACS189445_4760 [Spirochaetia bacterium]|nr:hypothetical protein FACS189445_4760 [Spirochaetia bacterium]
MTFYELHRFAGHVTDQNREDVQIVSDELDALMELAKNSRDVGILRSALYLMADGILFGNAERCDRGYAMLEGGTFYWENDERIKIEPFIFDETEKGGNFAWRALKNNDGTNCHTGEHDVRALYAIESLRRMQEKTPVPETALDELTKGESPILKKIGYGKHNGKYECSSLEKFIEEYAKLKDDPFIKETIKEHLISYRTGEAYLDSTIETKLTHRRY